MKNTVIYFNDNFFSSGLTTIYDENKNEIGSLNLKSMFSSSVEVLNQKGDVVIRGKFPFFSSKWRVTDKNDREVGLLKQRFSFASKKFEYTAHGRATYQIFSGAFSREYDVMTMEDEVVASFKKISGVFSSPAFQLMNYSNMLDNEELIAVVMGVNMIIKRNTAAASSATH